MAMREIQCEVCGERLAVPDWHEISTATREANGDEPKTHLVVGGDRLLHTCRVDG